MEKIEGKKKTLRTCPKGHKYYKSTDCPTCPICEKEKKPKERFLSLLSAPARRALEGEEITTLKKLSKYSKKDLLKLHGFGPATISVLEKALKAEGLSFDENKKT
jgi:DNA-directed RNA polymerase alpha subunit